MSETTTHLNDVDLATLHQLVESYQTDPEAGRSSWSARVQWLGGFRAEAQVRELPPVRADEPTWLAGTDTGPNAVEHLLGAFGQCLAVGYAANATVRGIHVNSLEISLHGEIDLPVFLGLTGGSAGYDRIHVEVHLDADAPREQLEELHRHVLSTSPVGSTLANPVQIDARLVT
jgi:uncharacterized OsmC-like protein